MKLLLLILLPISLQAFSIGRPIWAKADSEPFEVVTIVFSSYRYGNVTEDPTTTVFSRSSQGIRIPLTPLSSKDVEIYRGTTLYKQADPLTEDERDKARRIVAKLNTALETRPNSASSFDQKNPHLENTNDFIFKPICAPGEKSRDCLNPNVHNFLKAADDGGDSNED